MKKKPEIIISVPNYMKPEQIKKIREQYKEQYTVHLVISGKDDPRKLIQYFILNGLE